MKLLYEMPQPDLEIFEKSSEGEKLMYCLPFNVHEGKFVKGFVAFTNKKMYKILNGEMLGIYDIIGSSNFRTEVMYGSGGFYASINGSSTLICQFVVGRNLPRYAVMVKACEILSETKNEEPLTNDSPERFCPDCGRPYLHGSVICPFCMKKLEVYLKLWAMTKGLRLAMFFPFIVAGVSILMQFVLPVIMRHITDTYLAPIVAIDASQIDSIVYGFVGWVALLVSIDLVQRSLGVAEGRLLAIASGKFLMMLRTLLYEKIQALSLSSIQRHSTGDLMTRVSNDTATMQNFIIREFPSIFRQVVSLPIAVVILFAMNWVTALFVIVPIPFAIFLLTRFWDYMHSKNRRMWVASTRVYYILQDILTGIRVVKSFGQEDREIEKFNSGT
ncbi:MAG: ABC transporter transmembrane domain-containing protein, partial [Oscillospiraceae bacterium]|nr:ABC transporter transmembrane domain-containing protein [Oscillospiraceae bacterium]